jgi:hypothetical protein
MRHSVYIVLLFAGVASAGEIPVVPLVNIDPKQAAESPVWFSGVLPASNESWGWAFAVDRQYRALITHVAWYDKGGDGLSHSHSIGIWRDTVRDGLGLGPDANGYFPQISESELIVQAVIPSGTAAELVGPWRRMPINPIRLGPGNYYVVGRNHADSNDDLVFWTDGVIPGEPSSPRGVFLKGMSSGQPVFGPIRWGGWLTPDNDIRPIRGTITGPMLFAQIIIPEPSTGLLAMMACCGYGLNCRPRKTVAAKRKKCLADVLGRGDSFFIDLRRSSGSSRRTFA